MHFSGMFWYRCYSRLRNLQSEVLAIYEIPSKFPRQLVNSSKKWKFSCLEMEGRLPGTEMGKGQSQDLHQRRRRFLSIVPHKNLWKPEPGDGGHALLRELVTWPFHRLRVQPRSSDERLRSAQRQTANADKPYLNSDIKDQTELLSLLLSLYPSEMSAVGSEFLTGKYIQLLASSVAREQCWQLHTFSTRDTLG